MPYELSTEWAETYFGNRLYTSRWDSASATDKEKSLKQASSLLEAVYEFNPGTFFMTEGEEDCKDGLKCAVCEQALYLLTIDPTAYPDVLTMGISSASAGASVTFDRSMVAPFIAPTAKQYLTGIGTFFGTGESFVSSGELEW
jgi:hypothetical protein